MLWPYPIFLNSIYTILLIQYGGKIHLLSDLASNVLVNGIQPKVDQYLFVEVSFEVR